MISSSKQDDRFSRPGRGFPRYSLISLEFICRPNQLHKADIAHVVPRMGMGCSISDPASFFMNEGQDKSLCTLNSFNLDTAEIGNIRDEEHRNTDPDFF